MTARQPQVSSLNYRSKSREAGFLSLFRVSVSKFFIMRLVVCSTAVAACSSQNDSTLRAVEVGNPEDSKPTKPKPDVPMRLVQLELETTDLEEISQLEFHLAEVKLLDSSSSGEGYISISPSAQSGAKLNFLPRSRWTIDFNVPEDTTLNTSALRLSFAFNSEAPGNVWVGSNRYEIDKQTAPLLLEVTADVQVGAAQTPILISGTISKAQIFQQTPSSAPIPSGGAGTEPSSRPVYRLK